MANKPGHQGEHEVSRKTIACGNAGCSGATVVTNARANYSTRAAAGATGTRHSPLPPWGSATPSLGEGFMQNSGASRRGIVKSYLDVIARSESDEAIHSCFHVAAWIASLRSQ